MCSRFSQAYRINLKARWDRIRNPKNLQPELFPQYNIAPTDEATVIMEENGDWVLDRMIFGMVPHWAKDIKMGLNCLNARSETIAEKPSFRESFKKRRCIVPVDGYYEWQRDGKQKLPYRFVPKNGDVFALAGLWDKWKTPAGKTIHSFAIITTEPNKLAAQIHDRMPVILEPGQEEKWLDSKVTDQAELLSLLKPFHADEMQDYRVSTAMNSSAFKGQESIVPIAKDSK